MGQLGQLSPLKKTQKNETPKGPVFMKCNINVWMVELFLGPRSDKMRRGAKSTLLCPFDRTKNGTPKGPVFIGISYEVGISRLAMQPKPEHTERM